MTEAEMIFEAVARLLESTGALKTADVGRDSYIKFFLEIYRTDGKPGKPRRNADRFCYRLEWAGDEELLNGSRYRYSVFEAMAYVGEFEKANGDLVSVCRTVSSCGSGSYGEFLLRCAAHGLDPEAASPFPAFVSPR